MWDDDLDLIPGIGSAGDASKAVTKLGKFISKHIDDAPKVMGALIQVAKNVPNGDDVVKNVVKIIPAGTIDNMVDTIKTTNRITYKEFKRGAELITDAGKSADDILDV